MNIAEVNTIRPDYVDSVKNTSDGSIKQPSTKKADDDKHNDEFEEETNPPQAPSHL